MKGRSLEMKNSFVFQCLLAGKTKEPSKYTQRQTYGFCCVAQSPSSTVGPVPCRHPNVHKEVATNLAEETALRGFLKEARKLIQLSSAAFSASAAINVYIFEGWIQIGN